MAPRPAIFFDYGGTLTSRSSRGLPTEEAVAAIRAANERGYAVIVVSNQKAVGQGRMTEADLDRLRDHADRAIQGGGGHVDAWYFCVHDIDDGCPCRKPKAGLLRSAAEDLNLDLRLSAIVGDRDDRDIQAGRELGVMTALLLRDAESNRGGIEPDIADASLPSLVTRLLELLATSA